VARSGSCRRLWLPSLLASAAAMQMDGVPARDPTAPTLARTQLRLHPAASREAPRTVRTLTLQVGVSLGGELRAGLVDAYEIDLDRDQYLHFHLDQKDIDVYIDVIPPGGGRLFRADTLNGKTGPEEVHLVAERSGRYRLEVGALKSGAHGCYRARIRRLRRALPADRERAEAQLAAAEAGELSRDPGRFWEAAARYERALRLWAALGDRGPPQSGALYELGRLYFQRGLYRDARGTFARYRALAHELGSAYDAGVACNELGRVYAGLGEIAPARASYHEALRIWRTLGDHHDEATSLINLGELFQIHGDSWQALELFRQAREAAHRIADVPSEVNAWNGIGWAYRSVADWRRAKDAHQEALRLLNRSPNRPLAAVTLTQLGSIYLEAGETEQALLYLRQALALQRDPAAAAERAVTLNAMGLALQRLHADAQALVAFQRTLSLLAGHAAGLTETSARINLGWSYLQVHQPDQALAEYAKALERARHEQDRAAQGLALLGMALAERDRGNPILALHHGGAALEIFETLRTAAVRSDLKASYMARNEAYYGLLIDLLMAEQRRHPGGELARQALELSERSRARRLLDALTDKRALSSAAGPGAGRLQAEWRRLTAEIDAQDLASRDLQDAGKRQDAGRALSGLLDRASELAEQIRKETHAAGTTADPASTATDRLARALLDPDTTWLEYRLGEPRSFLWALSAEGAIQCVELPGRSVLEQRIRAFYRSLAAGDPPPEEAAGDAAESPKDGMDRDRAALELSRMLLGPVATHLGHQLVISAGGALQLLPFSALPDPGGKGELLLSSHEIAYVPSLHVLAELRARRAARRPPPDLLAMVADPVFGPSDPRLRGTPVFRAAPAPGELLRLAHAGEEVDAIRPLVPGERALVARGFEATRELVKSGRLGRYRMLDFITHGALRPGSGNALPAIVLSLRDGAGKVQDGYLRTYDLEYLDLPADLVVLSACSTALGPEIPSDGMFGLPQAFLSAGAQRVVVSLWNVGDRATAELMPRFFRHLLVGGLPAGNALRQAQLEMRAQPRWHDPTHWAGFVLQGDWN
jgi:CHAT domain-containing protein/tetratricopeptide (TPR) repeat protein